MPSLGIFRAGIAGALTSAGNLDVYAYGVPFLHANTGRIILHERVAFAEPIVTTSTFTQLIDVTSAVTWPAGANAFKGYFFRPVISYAAGQVASFSPAFHAQPTFRPTASVGDVVAPYMGFYASPSYQPNGPGITTTGGVLVGYYSEPLTSLINGATSGTLDIVTGFASYATVTYNPGLPLGGGQDLGTGTTVTALRHFHAGDPTAAGATITTQVGLDIEAITRGTTNLSLRSLGAAVQMRHAGPARLGSGTLAPDGGSVLHVDGGLTLKRTLATDANYTALLTDTIIEFPLLAGNRVVNLPTAASAAAGKIYIIKKTTGAPTITITPNGAETIDGGPNHVMTAVNAARLIYCTGTAWFVAGTYLV